MAVMYLGQIVELASVDEIFDAPLHPYTQALIASAPQPGARRAAPLLQGIYRTRPIPVRVPIPYPLSVCHG